MKKLSMILPAILLTGCATINRTAVYHGVKVENGQQPVETVEIENSGWKVLKLIPIGSGDPLHPNENTCRAFVDTVTLQNNLVLLDSEMKATGATAIANLTSRRTEESYLFIVLTRHAYHTSAVLVKDVAADGKSELP